MNREDLACAAGLFNGEGSFFVSTQAKAPRCSIGQSGDPEILLTFQDAVLGLGVVQGPYGPYLPNRKVRYTWRAQGFEEVQAVMVLLWFKLSSVKRQQAQFMMSTASPVGRRGRYNVSGGRRVR